MSVKEELLVSSENGVMTAVLNRPEFLNALTRSMMAELRAAVARAAKDPSVKVLVLTGAGRAFSAGADLAEMKDVSSLGEELRRHFNPMILALKNLEKPVIAKVNGVAAGAGAALAFACDLKICAAGAKFIPAFIKVGLIPDSGFLREMTRAMGASLALEHAWTNKPISATRAEHFGLVNKAVPSEDLDKETAALAALLAAAPARAAALTKRLAGASRGLEQELEYEAQLQEILGKSEDYKEGLSAFLESREPRFTGG